MHKKINIVERIERHAHELVDGECWETDYQCHGRGGHILVRSGDWQQMQYQHRIAYEAHHAEPIPDELIVMHTCDNPRCFNPEHLVLGTNMDNTQDMISKKRGFWQ